MKRLIALLVLALGPALTAHAASCVVMVTDLPFGAYRYNAGAPVDTTGSVSVECTDVAGGGPVGYTIALATGSSGNYAFRVMAGDGGELHYNVYVDGARTRVWGDDSGGSEAVAGTAIPPAPSDHPLFARIPAMQTGMGPGAYADQLTVLVSY
ncbi:MAG TPA: spore coat U domain-containing protein [Verrucomicrobiae bacterium]|nr:spore coat U domain-containing protein [Verrucomicrobiae bacterium]